MRCRGGSAGHLEILKWARENGCEWGVLTCAYAAEGGHLEVLVGARRTAALEPGHSRNSLPG